MDEKLNTLGSSVGAVTGSFLDFEIWGILGKIRGKIWEIRGPGRETIHKLEVFGEKRRKVISFWLLGGSGGPPGGLREACGGPPGAPQSQNNKI